jgi:small ligand-binding sensory domain FIST
VIAEVFHLRPSDMADLTIGQVVQIGQRLQFLNTQRAAAAAAASRGRRR